MKTKLMSDSEQEMLTAFHEVGVSYDTIPHLYLTSKMGLEAVRLRLRRKFEKDLPYFWRHAVVLKRDWKLAAPLLIDEINTPPVVQEKYDGVRTMLVGRDGRSLERGTLCAICGILINEGWDLCSKCEEV